MENVTKALLIVAGVFLAILILSALVIFYNQISDYYENEHELTMIEQTQKFNAKFESYNKKNIRGSELISFMNRVIDYNASESYFDGDYERIKVTITLGGTEILNQFKYETNDSTSKNKYLTEKITNTNSNATNWDNDKNLIAITNTSSDLCAELASIGIQNPTDTQLQQLASKISNVIVDESSTNSTMAVYNRLKRAELIEDVLGLELGKFYDAYIRINEENGITASDVKSQNRMNYIKEIVSQYYQYMQFKRAYFDCTEMIYDAETKRVTEMNFTLQTKNGTVVFD